MLDDQEESVRIAVKALGDMRNSGPRSRTPPTSSYISTSSPSSSRDPSIDTATATASPPAFVSRMSSFPLVGSALRVYEQGKASSRVVKYGAEMVESSVKSISRPVIDRLPVNVNQIDEFACRQLDRLDRYRRPSTSEQPPSPTSASSMAISTSTSPSASDRDRGRPKLKTKTLDGTAVDDEDGPDISTTTTTTPPSPGRSKRGHSWRGGERGVPSWLEANSPFVAPPPPPPDSRASTPTQVGDDMEGAGKEELGSEHGAGPESQVAQRSRWQAVLLEAGGLSAALSEESMRRLKYCLHWLQYATAHIDAQILILRDFTANLQPLPSNTSVSTSRRPPISEEHMRKLTDVRRDIVHTIRQVVDVVSKYAGGALPEPARGRVRGFILKLPQRWASKASGPGVAGVGAGSGALGGLSERERERETVAAAGTGTGALRRPGGQRRAAQRERGTGAGADGSMRSGPSSRATSPSASPRVARAVVGNGGAPSSGADGSGGNAMSASAALVASQRILALATESLDMMRNVTGVVKESLDRADAWVGRLRTVGIQRGTQELEDTNTTPTNTADNNTYELTTDMRSRTSTRTSSYDFDFNFSSSSASSPLPSSPSLYMRQRGHERSGSMQSMGSVDEGYGSVVGSGSNNNANANANAYFNAKDTTANANANANAPPSSPFSFSSGSGASSNWGSSSSVPSTPGVYTPGYSGGGNIPTIGIGKMNLGSRYNTPRRGVVGLPRGDDDDGDEGGGGAESVEGMVVEPKRGGEADRERKVLMVDTMNGKVQRGAVVVVGGEDGDGDRERGLGGMDVDG